MKRAAVALALLCLLPAALVLHARRVESVHATLRRAGYDDDAW